MSEPLDPERPGRLLDDVLSRPEFGDQPVHTPSWLESLLDRFDFFVDLPVWLDWVIAGIVVTLAISLVVLLLRDGGVFARRKAVTPELGEDADAFAANPDTLFREGLAAHDAGRHSDAVVLLFRAIVARLSRIGLLLDDPSRTNREHQRDLRRRRHEADAFARAIPPFERVRYGSREATADEAAVVRDAAAAIFSPEASA